MYDCVTLVKLHHLLLASVSSPVKNEESSNTNFLRLLQGVNELINCLAHKLHKQVLLFELDISHLFILFLRIIQSSIITIFIVVDSKAQRS